MDIFLSDGAYGLTLLLSVMAFALILEWVSFYIPSPQANGVRKFLFHWTYPFLLWSHRFFSFRLGRIQSRGLLTAFLLLTLGYLGVPWLVLLSYSLRG